MSTKSIFSFLFSVAVIAGCSVSERITKRSQIHVKAFEGKPLLVLATDSSLYELNEYVLTDTSLVGKGVVRSEGSRGFSGELPLNHISYIQSSHSSFWKGVVGAGAVAIFLTTAIPALESAEFSLTPQEGYHPPYVGGFGGGGSCPFIYAWNGKNYILEGEAFSVALGRSLEMTTGTVLGSLAPAEGNLRVRLSNERPETHHFNSVRMVAVEANANARVVLDASNRAWQVADEKAAFRVTTREGNDITSVLRSADKLYWESGIDTGTAVNHFTDRLDLMFEQPSPFAEGTLVVRAINTKFSNAVFDHLFRFLGDQALSFLQAAENDPEMAAILKDWIVESSLKVSVWNGNEWSEAGMILPEANEVAFTRAVRFQIPTRDSNIRIRLECLADVWKLDAVGIDWGSSIPLSQRPLRLRDATGPAGEDLRHILSANDDHYAVLFPPQFINLCFESPASLPPGKKLVYILNVGGYLYEWISSAERSHSEMASVPEHAKIPLLKLLLRNKDLFLPPIYADWLREKP